MVDEVISFLCLKKGYKALDATVGCGRHASFILEKIQPDGVLIGIDRDPATLEIAKKHLSKFSKICRLAYGNFRDIDKILPDLGIDKIDAALFDLGISSYQLEDETRGFSFARDGFLDMRMDPSAAIACAFDIVNKCGRKELENIIRDFGEERYFRRITGFILERRKVAPIKSTGQLSGLIEEAVGKWYRFQKIHPATRTFQALRIAVNEELANLDEALGRVLNFLSHNARLCVISFHSLEDRIVKVRFKQFEKDKLGRVITKKPIIPKDGEVRENPRSRSAKLRVFEKHEL